MILEPHELTADHRLACDKTRMFRPPDFEFGTRSALVTAGRSPDSCAHRFAIASRVIPHKPFIARMHSWELAELAAYVASRGDLLRNFGHPDWSAALGEFWIASKCRLDRWNRTLKRMGRATTRGKDDRSQSRLGGVCREVLIGEILSRVWASVASAYDSFDGVCEAEPLAASVLNGHLDATNRVLNLLSAGFTPISPIRPEINRLRRQAQRWTDLLLGRFGWAPGIAQFAHDAARDRFRRRFFAYRSPRWTGRMEPFARIAEIDLPRKRQMDDAECRSQRPHRRSDSPLPAR